MFAPNSAYKPQKLIALVSSSTTATIKSTTPNVPEIIPVRYKIEMMAAMTSRIILSTLPIFFFIIFLFTIITDNY